MRDNFLREEIRKALTELLKGGTTSYPMSSFNQFPYQVDGVTPKFPEDIHPQKDYVQDFISLSKNQDLYSFPMDEFLQGLKIEKQRKDRLNILDIATDVINKLKQDPHFYSDLMS